jgi:hypothetical protein
MNTIENNKLIAEFMGLVESSIPNNYWTKKSDEGFGMGQMVELQYHEDWNSLISAVTECYSLDENNSEYYEAIYYSLADLDIEKVYKAVVEFIKYYNLQN